MKKRKMSQKKFQAIWIPIISLLVILAAVATALMNYYSLTMDMVLGRGERHVTTIEGAENWDTNYYINRYLSDDEALQAATEVARKVANEGVVLLKNGTVDGKQILPLSAGTAVTPFGYRYMFPVYCPLGSASTSNSYQDFSVTNAYSESFQTALAANFTVNKTVESRMAEAAMIRTDAAPGTTPANEVAFPFACTGSNTFLYEYDPSIYRGTEESCSDTVGVVFIGRETGEAGDLKWDAYEDGTAHQLTLSQSEKETILFAKENCKKGVIAILNLANVMELGLLENGEYAVDALLWVGYPGSIGAMSMSDILCGKTNPSGRTADIYIANVLEDPTFPNTGIFTYEDADLNGDAEQSFLEYEEGVYHGYKYYETADVMDPAFNYNESVVYPFGYGLSYTAFEQSISEVEDNGKTVAVTVKVENTGKTDGKEVVQLYYTAPYTNFDVDYRIEKPVKVLLAFDKVEVPAGQSRTIQLAFNKEDMASYCYTVQNADGTRGAYVLENGEYILTLGKNSHEAWDTAEISVPATIWYDNSNPRQSELDAQSSLDENGDPTGIPANLNAVFTAASNQFEQSNAYMLSDSVTLLSRADWQNSFPSAPDELSRNLDASVKKTILDYGQKTFDYMNNELLGNNPASLVYKENYPTEEAENGLTVSDMRGLSYYDESWDELLDQLDYSSKRFWQLLYSGTYNLSELKSIGHVASINGEGPTGIGVLTRTSNGTNSEAKSCSYPCGVVVASTWNVDLVYELGEILAQECMNFKVKNGTFSGMTAPSMNLHRSPFGGRNCEFYSEDPVLTGKTASAQIAGMSDGGLYTIIKHFALNNQETAKTMNSGMCTWATEQAMREEYLRVFEIVFKETKKHVTFISDDSGTHKTIVMRGATGVMTSFNRVGAIPAGGNYYLITGVLRNEWGFNGIVQTDMPCQTNKDLLLRSGATVEMSFNLEKPQDTGSATMHWLMRRAAHDIAYVTANSIAVNGVMRGTVITYDISPWRIILACSDAAIGLFAIAMVIFMIHRRKAVKNHPEQYKRSRYGR